MRDYKRVVCFVEMKELKKEEKWPSVHLCEFRGVGWWGTGLRTEGPVFFYFKFSGFLFHFPSFQGWLL